MSNLITPATNDSLFLHSFCIFFQSIILDKFGYGTMFVLHKSPHVQNTKIQTSLFHTMAHNERAKNFSIFIWLSLTGDLFEIFVANHFFFKYCTYSSQWWWYTVWLFGIDFSIWYNSASISSKLNSLLNRISQLLLCLNC